MPTVAFLVDVLACSDKRSSKEDWLVHSIPQFMSAGSRRKSEQGAWGSGYTASMVQKQSRVSSAHFSLLILSKFRAQGIAPPTADKFFHPSLLRHGNPSQTWPEAHLLGDSQFCRVDKTTTIHICVETFKNNHKEEKMETIVKKNSKIVLKNSQQIISLQQQYRTRQNGQKQPN